MLTESSWAECGSEDILQEVMACSPIKNTGFDSAGGFLQRQVFSQKETKQQLLSLDGPQWGNTSYLLSQCIWRYWCSENLVCVTRSNPKRKWITFRFHIGDERLAALKRCPTTFCCLTGHDLIQLRPTKVSKPRWNGFRCPNGILPST